MRLINVSSIIVGAREGDGPHVQVLNTLIRLAGRLGKIHHHPAEILIQNGVRHGRDELDSAVVLVQVRGLKRTFSGKNVSFVKAALATTDSIVTYLLKNEDRLEKLWAKEEQAAGGKNRRRTRRTSSKGKRGH